MEAQFGSIVQRVKAGEESAHADVFAWIEDAALRDLTACIAEVDREIAPLSPDDAVRIPCLKGLAHALCYENRFEDALSYLDEAIRISRTRGLADDEASLQLTRVQPLERLGRTAEAEASARGALAAFEGRGDVFNAARAMVNLGVVRRVRGDAAEALDWFDRAAPAFKEHALASGTVATNRAEALLDLDRFDESARSFEHARTIFESAGHTLGAAIAQGNLADLYSRLGRADEAALGFQAARELFASANAPADAARLLAEEAEAYATVGAHWRALDLFASARVALDQPGMRLERVRAMMGEGLALLRVGSPKATSVLSEARELSRNEDASILHDDACLALAQALLELGDLAKARAELAELIARLGTRPLRLAQARIMLANTELSLANHQTALALLNDCAADCALFAPLRSAHLHASANALRAAGNPHDAWQRFEQALSAADTARAAFRCEQLRASFAESHRGMIADATRLACELGGPQKHARVFDLIERIRARSLADSCAGRRVTGATGERSEAVDALSCALNAAYKQAASVSGEAPAQHIALREKIRILETRLDQATHLQRASGNSLVAMSPISLSDAQAQLKPDQGALIWYRRGDSLDALLVRSAGAASFTGILAVRDAAALSRRQTLAIDVATRTPGSNRPNPAFDALCTVLSKHVAPELADLNELLVVPCAEVDALPICAALLAICPRLTTHVVPSMTSASIIRRRNETAMSSPSFTTLIVSAADDVAPQIEQEAREVARVHAAPTVLFGEGARADAFLSLLPSADLVHIACHCDFDPQFPMSSRLRLADRWVAAREFFGVLRPGCVVVLAACESGRTSDTTGEDRFGLVRAMLVGGASMVVASRWRLHDSAAAQLFPRLHAGIVEELSRTTCKRHASTLPAAASRATARVQRESTHLPWHAWQGLFAMGGLT